MNKSSLPLKTYLTRDISHDKNLRHLTLIAAFIACFMLFVSVYLYTESVKVTKRNGDLELLTIQLEGEVSRLRDKRMLEAIQTKKVESQAKGFDKIATARFELSFPIDLKKVIQRPTPKFSDFGAVLLSDDYEGSDGKVPYINVASGYQINIQSKLGSCEKYDKNSYAGGVKSLLSSNSSGQKYSIDYEGPASVFYQFGLKNGNCLVISKDNSVDKADELESIKVLDAIAATVKLI